MTKRETLLFETFGVGRPGRAGAALVVCLFLVGLGGCAAGMGKTRVSPGPEAPARPALKSPEAKVAPISPARPGMQTPADRRPSGDSVGAAAAVETAPARSSGSPARVVFARGSAAGAQGRTGPAQSVPAAGAGKKKGGKAAAEDKGGVVLNFEGADLYEVIKVIAEEIGVNYVVEPGIKGSVTLHTSREIPRKALRDLLDNILGLHGLAAVPDASGVVNVVRSKDIASLSGITAWPMEPGADWTIGLVPLAHVPSSEAAKILKPFLTAGAQLVDVSRHNLLMVVERRDNLARVEALLRAVDQDLLEGVRMEVWELQNAPVEDVAKELDSILASYGYSSKDSVRVGYRSLPVKRLNALVFVSADAKVIRMARDLLTVLDQTPVTNAPRLYVYPVRNGTAKDLAALLQDVFEKKKKEKEEARKAPTETAKETEEKAAPPNPFADIQAAEIRRQAGGEAPVVAEVLEDEIRVVADETRNLLVIQATPRDYHQIRILLNQLDILPRQVLIEVLIAEVQLDKSRKLGVEWQYLFDMGRNYNATVSSSVNLAGNISSGFLYSVEKTERLTAAVRALAEENAVNILSSPHVLASDNKEAKIDVSEEIPVVTGRVSSVDNNDLITETVQYRDTGVLLTVTPHINEHGLVTMDISQEVSELSDKTVAGITNPIFFKRKAQTTLSVQNGQTIVIGGLIREKKSKGDTGVPLLKDLPLLGYAFKRVGTETSRTELMIFITPHVIANLNDIDTVTRWFRGKMEGPGALAGKGDPSS
jgi:general secretion pathway protein D